MEFLNDDFNIENIDEIIEKINFLKELNSDNNVIAKFNAIGKVLEETSMGDEYNKECSSLISSLFDFIYTECEANEEKVKLKSIEFENKFLNKNYIIENYIVSYLYTNYISAVEDFNFYEVIDVLIFSVGLIKSILMIIWNKNKEISDNDFIDIIHWVYKNICLNKKYIYEILSNKKYNTLAYTYIFAK